MLWSYLELVDLKVDRPILFFEDTIYYNSCNLYEYLRMSLGLRRHLIQYKKEINFHHEAICLVGPLSAISPVSVIKRE